MKSKIFISINLPDKTKKRLLKAVERWRDLPVKWVKEENLHITLVFLGFVSEDMIPEICQKIKTTSEKSEVFDMEFDQIRLFPSAQEPRMIVLTGKANEELRGLVNNIEKSLKISNAPKKNFRPHVTLGRIRKLKWEALQDKPEIEEKFPLMVAADSVSIMASNFEKEGSVYSMIESCPLS